MEDVDTKPWELSLIKTPLGWTGALTEPDLIIIGEHHWGSVTENLCSQVLKSWENLSRRVEAVAAADLCSWLWNDCQHSFDHKQIRSFNINNSLIDKTVKNLQLILRPLSWWWLWPTLFLWKQNTVRSINRLCVFCIHVQTAQQGSFNLAWLSIVAYWGLTTRLSKRKRRWRCETSVYMLTRVLPLLFGLLFSWPSVSNHWHGLK